MKIVLFAGNANIGKLFPVLEQTGTEISYIVIPGNRLGSEKITEVLKLLRKYPVRTIIHSKTSNAFISEVVKKEGIEAGISWSYPQLFPPELISSFSKGIINLHGALLPQYRGANVLNWCLVNGEQETGITFHLIDEGIDTGPILSQKTIPIAGDDNALSLKAKIEDEAIHLFSSLWPSFLRGELNLLPQSETNAQHFRQRNAEDGKIIWTEPAIKIHNLVRALVKPWPGAYFILENEKYVVYRSSLPANVSSTEVVPGKVLDVTESGLLVGTGNGAIYLQDIERNGQPVDLSFFKHTKPTFS